MSKVLKTAQAGTLESSDIVVTVAPADAGSGIHIDLQSIVFAQYGAAIETLIRQTLKDCNIEDAEIKAVDRGALDCTIKARIICALMRAGVAVEGVKII